MQSSKLPADPSESEEDAYAVDQANEDTRGGIGDDGQAWHNGSSRSNVRA